MQAHAFVLLHAARNKLALLLLLLLLQTRAAHLAVDVPSRVYMGQEQQITAAREVLSLETQAVSELQVLLKALASNCQLPSTLIFLCQSHK